MLTRLFESFANTLLDLGLPKINEWLRNKLGPHAIIGAVKSEGRRVLLDDVTIPIGPRGLLTLDKATCTLGANAAAGLPTARLSSFEGMLRFAGPDSPTFEADLRFEETANDESAWVHGRLTITDATWTIGKDELREGHIPMNGAARLVVTSTAWSLEEGELHTGTADVHFAGSGRLNGDEGGSLASASLKAKDARARHFFDAIAALADAALPISFPEALGDPLLSGEVTWRDGKGTGDARIEADAFRLTLTGSGSESALDAQVNGDISVARLIARQAIPDSVDVGALAVDLKIAGSAKEPRVTGSLRAPALRVLPSIAVRDVDIAIKTDHERFTAQGSLALAAGAVALNADIPFAPSSAKGVDLRVTAVDAATIASLMDAAGLGEMIGPEGGAATFAVPQATRASGQLRVELAPELTVNGAVLLDTPRSALKLEPLRFANGRVDGTKLVGSLAVADAIAAGLLPFDIHPHPARSTPFVGELAIDGLPNDMVLDGKVSARHLELAIASRADVPPFVFDDVTSHLRITREYFAYTDVTGRGYGAAIRVNGKAPFEGAPDTKEDRLVVTIDHGNAWLVDALARLATGGVLVRRERRGEQRHKDEMWIPEGATLVGEARLDHTLRLTADLALEHGPDTALLANIVVSPAPDLLLDGSRIVGRLGIADALLAGAFDTTMRPLPVAGHTAKIEATLKGRFDDAVLSGTAIAPRVHVAMPSSPAVPLFVVTDLSTVFRIDREKIVWHKLVAHAYGGTVNSSGLIGYSEKLTGLRSAAEWNDVDVSLLPLDPNESHRGATAARFVTGKLCGRMRFNRNGPDAPQNPIVGSGDVELVAPEYPVLMQTAPMVSRYGLPPPGPAGAGNLTLKIELLGHGWRLTDVTASVEDCLLTGAIDITFDAALSGRFILNFGERYLRKSRLLTIPAVFAESVDLPVHVAGVLAKPMVQTDIASTLGRLAIHNRVTNVLDDVVEDIGNLLGVGSRSSSRTAVAAPQPEPEDHDPAANDPLLDEDAIVREMIAKGADWDEIDWRLAELKRKRPRYRVE